MALPPGAHQLDATPTPEEAREVLLATLAALLQEFEPGDRLVVEYTLNTTESAMADLLGGLGPHVAKVSGEVELTDTLTVQVVKRRPVAKDDLPGGGAF